MERIQIKVENRYETESMSKTIDNIFEDIKNQIKKRMNVVLDENIIQKNGMTSMTIIVRENNDEINVDLTSEYGDQNSGYLINIEITACENKDEDISKESVISVYSDLEDIIERSVNLKQKF